MTALNTYPSLIGKTKKTPLANTALVTNTSNDRDCSNHLQKPLRIKVRIYIFFHVHYIVIFKTFVFKHRIDNSLNGLYIKCSCSNLLCVLRSPGILLTLSFRGDKKNYIHNFKNYNGNSILNDWWKVQIDDQFKIKKMGG